MFGCVGKYGTAAASPTRNDKPVMASEFKGVNYFRPSAKTSGASCFPCFRVSAPPRLPILSSQQHDTRTLSERNPRRTTMLSFPCDSRVTRSRPIPLSLYIRTSIAAMEQLNHTIHQPRTGTSIIIIVSHSFLY